MQSLPYVPVDPRWLVESPAFLSDDARVVRALIKLLEHAWNSAPAGTVPAGFKPLCAITGLDEVTLSEHHADLFEGWTLVDGRYRFDLMYSLCERINARFADALQGISDQAAAVMQGPEEFELKSEEVVSTSKVKHRLPKGWMLTPDLKNWCRANGIVTDEDMAFVAEKFTSYYYAKATLMLDWCAAFRNFALKEDRTGLPSSCRRNNVVGISRSSRYGSAGASAQTHNANALNAAMRRNGGRGFNGGAHP